MATAAPAHPTAPARELLSFTDAAQRVTDAFPFPGYITPERISGSCAIAADVVTRYLKPGSRILDFGAGPAEKPVIFSLMGYRVSACDDLSDDWHLHPGNREKILQFAEDHGVDFHLCRDGAPLPYKPESFDMVMLADVLEHFHDSPRGLLEHLHRLIVPGGLLFITVPNAGNLRKRVHLLLGKTNLPDYGHFYWSSGPWRGHVREHVRSDLQSMAMFLGMTTLELRGCHAMLDKIPSRVRPVWKALCAVCDGFSDTWCFVARKESGKGPMTEPPDIGGLRERLIRFESM